MRNRSISALRCDAFRDTNHDNLFSLNISGQAVSLIVEGVCVGLAGDQTAAQPLEPPLTQRRCGHACR